MKAFRTIFPGLPALALVTVLVAGCSGTSTEPRDLDAWQNAGLIVSGAALETNLAAAGQVLIDTRSASAYAAGHIPNAISLPVSPGGALFDKGGAGPDATDLKSPAEIAAVLGAAGVSSGARLVVYGTDIDWLVGRMFWMLEYLGASNVVLLDGGFTKWQADARPVSTTDHTLPAATFTPAVVPSRLVTKADVLAHYDDTDDYVIVDSRNTSDWAASRIPHAVNILVSDVMNTDKTMKTALELDALFAAKGVTRDRIVYSHCYVGYRSSQGYFVFRLMGYHVAHYDGSWAEWNADPDTPKES